MKILIENKDARFAHDEGKRTNTIHYTELVTEL